MLQNWKAWWKKVLKDGRVKKGHMENNVIPVHLLTSCAVTVTQCHQRTVECTASQQPIANAGIFPVYVFVKLYRNLFYDYKTVQQVVEYMYSICFHSWLRGRILDTEPYTRSKRLDSRCGNLFSTRFRQGTLLKVRVTSPGSSVR